MNIGTRSTTLNREFNGFKLTGEQDHSVDLMVEGKNLKIKAYAGASKTFTMAAGSFEMPGRGLYISFNKAIADEAASILKPGTASRTAHSLAYGGVGYKYKDRLQRINGYVIADYLKMKMGVNGFSLAASGNLIIDTITRFTQSGDQSIEKKHAPWSQLEKVAEPEQQIQIVDQLIPWAKKAWEMMVDINGTMPVTHDVYLKIWTLTRPKLRYDYIMFDEAQDASPMMLDLVQHQYAQQIYVGDSFQQIYSWRGAVNAMDEIKTENEAQLTQSFRFGQEIADTANDILNNQLELKEPVNIRGFSEVESSLGQCTPDAILSRTNGELIQGIINCQENGLKMHISGGSGQAVSLVRGLRDLQQKGESSHRELSLFNSFEEVEEYAETDSGGDIKAILKQIKSRGTTDLIALLECSSDDKKEADVVLSTAHKAKGLEFPNVLLGPDFRGPEDEGYTPEDTRLTYVAATRAQNMLDISKCKPVLSAIYDYQQNNNPRV